MFAAEGHVHTIVAGSLTRQQAVVPGEPLESGFGTGFVATAGVGYGVGVGAGYQVAVAMGVDDPDALVREVLRR